ncbi:MAG: diacylglycerol kinase family protein [Anaerolineales bacterium]
MRHQSGIPDPYTERSRSLWGAFGHAFDGWRSTLRSQRNARIQVGIAALVVLSAIWVGVPAVGWGLLFLAMGLVFGAELVNTAIEALVDLVSPEKSPLAAQAKDAGAGAVLIASVASVLLGLAVLGPPMLRRLGL